MRTVTQLFTSYVVVLQEEIQREAMEQAERMAEDAKVRIDPLEHKTVAELDELEEDDAGYGDSRLLDAYRQKRLAEMKALAAKNKFGDIYPLVRADFVREVTDASKEVWVIVFLYQDHVMDSKLLARVLPSVARKHRAAKFMSIRADACIENYPDRNVPTLLLYHDGACQTQIIGLGELGGPKVDEKSEYAQFLAWRVVLGCAVVVTSMLATAYAGPCDDTNNHCAYASTESGSLGLNNKAEITLADGLAASYL